MSLEMFLPSFNTKMGGGKVTFNRGCLCSRPCPNSPQSQWVTASDVISTRLKNYLDTKPHVGPSQSRCHYHCCHKRLVEFD